MPTKLVASCSVLAILAACAGGHGQNYADEDTAYYLAHAQGNYAPPGPPSDPWGPYIRIAAARFDVPQMWIRQVMRVESGGHEYSNGQLIVSDAGAMGLMQLEPGTYQEMAARYGLANDPFNPLDNILAGTAYIHEMYQIYGSPGFLAAYNAGPGRLDSYIHYQRPLPLQTVNYVDMIAPNIDGYYPQHRSAADEWALNTRPMGYDGGILPAGFVPEAPTPAELSAPVEVASLSPAQSAYANSSSPVTVPDTSLLPHVAQVQSAPMQPANATQAPAVSLPSPPPAQPTMQAPVASPKYVLTTNAKPPQVPRPPYNNRPSGFALVPSATASPARNAVYNPSVQSWAIQVGAYDTVSGAKAALGMAELTGAHVLQNAEPVVTKVSTNSGILYRARFVGLQHAEAINACSRLSAGPTGCAILSPGEHF